MNDTKNNYSFDVVIDDPIYKMAPKAIEDWNSNKVELVEGAKFDDGKVPIELFPGEAIFAISSVLGFGAKKYAPRNWEKGIRWGRVFGATMRHLWSWWQGKGPTTKNFVFGELDTETGFSHLWHAGCCIVFLITYEDRKIGEDDRP